jgi:hypothetical protein
MLLGRYGHSMSDNVKMQSRKIKCELILIGRTEGKNPHAKHRRSY